MQNIFAQISTNEKPYSFVNSKFTESRSIPIIEMPSLNTTQLNEEDSINGIARFGFIHSTELNMINSGVWTILGNGDKLWQLKIYCPNASSINLLYDTF